MKKSLKTNYIYNLICQVLTMLLPLVTTPYLSRVLGSEKIGIYSFTTSILSYFILFGGLGINMYGQREIAFNQDDMEKRSKIFWELFLLKFIMIFVSYCVFAIFLYNDINYGFYYKILTIELLANVLDITWFYQGLEDFKKITIRNIVIKIVSLIAVFLFVKKPEDLWIYFVIYCLSNFFGYSVFWLQIKRYVVLPNWKSLKIFSHLKSTVSLFVPQIAIQVYTVLDKTMLGFLLKDMNEVGYYEQSQKIVKMGLLLVTALGAVMAPRIANLFATNKDRELNDKVIKVFNVVSFVAFPLCFGIISISSNFVPWFFGDGYAPVVILMYIFSFLILGIGFNNITGVQYLISVKKQNIFTISVVIGAAVNVVLNLVLIPIFKSNGAALSTVIAEFVILFVQIIYLKNVFDFKKILKENIKYLFVSAFMCIVVFYLGTFLQPVIISTCIQIIAGIIVYLIILMAIKDKILDEIIEMLKKVLKKVIK